jgi:hypothetical protein
VGRDSAIKTEASQASYLRFGAAAGGLESFWGYGPETPGVREKREAATGTALAHFTLDNGGFIAANVATEYEAGV